MIAESLEPGANVSAVARRHGLFPQQLYTWRRGLRERAEAMSFVPAMVERENAGALPGPPPQSVSGQIVIETGGLVIRVPDHVSPDPLVRFLLSVPVTPFSSRLSPLSCLLCPLSCPSVMHLLLS